MMHFPIRTLRNERGQSLVEFALVMPLLLLLVFGATEFSRAWLAMNTISAASREGCRLAVVTGPDVAAVTARVQDVCAAGRVTPTNITVTGPVGDPERRVTVTVECDFVVIPGTVLGTFSGTIPLRTSAVMRHESF
jgi:Flp pilus assembly protein TadG